MAWSAETIGNVKAMVIAGSDVEEIAVANKLPRKDVTAICELLGLTISPLEKLEWCDRCASHRRALDPVTGWCEVCTERRKIELQREKDAEEEARLEREVMQQDATLRKQRERMRERFGANPRKGKPGRSSSS